MKLHQVVQRSLIVVIIIAGMMLSGCSDNSVLAPTESSGKSSIKFINIFSSPQSSLKKLTVVSKYIDKDTGGNIHMHHIAADNQSEVIVDLIIPPNSIDYSKSVSISYNDDYNVGQFDLVFAPHGTVFSTPALLVMECKNVDLSGINPNAVQFYYVNDNGDWEVHPTHEIYVDPVNKIVRIVAAQIPHFSRYAIGAE